jgi:hypothetical protein
MQRTYVGKNSKNCRQVAEFERLIQKCRDEPLVVVYTSRCKIRVARSAPPLLDSQLTATALSVSRVKSTTDLIINAVF